MYLLINTNLLIPKIKHFNSLNESMEELQYETILRNQDWNNKIYVVKKNEQDFIYSSDGKNIYLINLTNYEKKHIYTYKKSDYNGNKYWIKYNTLSKQDNNEIIQDIKIINNMNLVINDKKKQNVIFDDTNNNLLKIQQIEELTDNNSTIDIEKDEINNAKKYEMIKMIEEVNELYQKELYNIKKIELNLKTFDSKLKKLEKTKKDNIINEIIRTQSEYRTWKKIKYCIKDDLNEVAILKPINELEESKSTIPILFLSKFNYIEKIQNNESIKKLLNKINLLNLNDLYTNNILPTDDIVQFCNKYMKLSKELHYHFDDHEWNYLENEMNLSSTNKLGSNVITSSKL